MPNKQRGALSFSRTGGDPGSKPGAPVAGAAGAASAQAQLGLEGLPEETLALVKHGEFTAERYEREHKGECDGVAFLFSSEGWSVRKLAERFGRSQNTIRAMLRGRGLLSVDALRAETRERAMLAARALTARLEGAGESMPWSQVPMALDVSVKVAQLLDGGPTEIVERRAVVRVEDWNAWLAEARERAGAVPAARSDGDGEGTVALDVAWSMVREGAAMDDGAGIGFGGENSGALRGPAGAAGAGTDGPGEASADGEMEGGGEGGSGVGNHGMGGLG